MQGCGVGESVAIKEEEGATGRTRNGKVGMWSQGGLCSRCGACPFWMDLISHHVILPPHTIDQNQHLPVLAKNCNRKPGQLVNDSYGVTYVVSPNLSLIRITPKKSVLKKMKRSM